jgi:pimeloyl-ACP methyl ester carboxylesterase
MQVSATVIMKILLGLVCSLAISGCFAPFEAIHGEALRNMQASLEFSSLDVEGHKLLIVESGDRKKQLVLFIHGTPGSWEGYAEYLQMNSLASRAHLVAMDRPGFGEFSRDEWLPPFQEQASILMQLRQLNHSTLPIIIVGHSLGGSIAYRMAVDFPEDISGMVVISAPVDPMLSKRRWYNVLASYAVISWMLPDSLLKANREMNPLQEELAAMEPLLPEIRSNVTVIQGRQDKLVKFGNLGFAEKRLTHANFRAVPVQDKGHFVLWEDPELIAAEILALLDVPAL